MLDRRGRRLPRHRSSRAHAASEGGAPRSHARLPVLAAEGVAEFDRLYERDEPSWVV